MTYRSVAILALGIHPKGDDQVPGNAFDFGRNIGIAFQVEKSGPVKPTWGAA